MATTLKLSPKLKVRVARAAKANGKSAHAFMLDAIAAETERAEQRRKWVAEGLVAERELIARREAYDGEQVPKYFEARAAGRKVKRPKLAPWRG